MPIYEYRCEKGHTFEAMQRMVDDPLTSCSTCGAPVQRVFHPVAVHFKGSGFYNTDYGKKKAGASSDPGSKSESTPRRSPRSRSPRTRSPPRSDSKSSKLLLVLRLVAVQELVDGVGAVPGDTWMSPSRSQQVPSSTSVSSELPVATSANRRHQRRALHVGLERLGRLPADPRQAEERARRLGLGADRPQHLLLARGAGAVVLRRRARVLADARVAERAACRRGGSHPCGSGCPSRSCRTAASRCASCC